MTLQQKLLAKQSKKGFTLVELVVVIAILGILAAIAIPAVIGIVNSANESQAKTDAAALNTAVNTLFTEVDAGTVNSSNKGSIKDTNSLLPAAGVSASARRKAALKLTLQEAMEYQNLTSLSNKLDDFACDKDTMTIYAKVDKSHNPGNKNDKLTSGTTFAQLGYTDNTATTPAASTPASTAAGT